jgi:hypothetical protein
MLYSKKYINDLRKNTLIKFIIMEKNYLKIFNDINLNIKFKHFNQKLLTQLIYCYINCVIIMNKQKRKIALH